MTGILIQSCGPEHEHYFYPLEDPRSTFNPKEKMLTAANSKELFLGVPSHKIEDLFQLMEGICKDTHTGKNRYSTKAFATVNQLLEEESNVVWKGVASITGGLAILGLINWLFERSGNGPTSGVGGSRIKPAKRTPPIPKSNQGARFSLDPSISAWNSYTAYCSPKGHVIGEGYKNWDMTSISAQPLSFSIKPEYGPAAVLGIGLAVILTIAMAPALIVVAA